MNEKFYELSFIDDALSNDFKGAFFLFFELFKKAVFCHNVRLSGIIILPDTILVKTAAGSSFTYHSLLF